MSGKDKHLLPPKYNVNKAVMYCVVCQIKTTLLSCAGFCSASKIFGAEHHFLTAFLAGPYCPAESFPRQLQQQPEPNVYLSLSNPLPSLLAKALYQPSSNCKLDSANSSKTGINAVSHTAHVCLEFLAAPGADVLIRHMGSFLAI